MALLTWQILRTGSYPQGDITKDMLQELSQTFGQRGDIPIGKGHDAYFWNDNLPAEGWIYKNRNHGVTKDGKTFVVEGVELLEPLATEYSEGRYKKWSAVIGRDAEYDEKNDAWSYGKWELYAVDVLGRTAPAIKDLNDLTSNKRKPELDQYNIIDKGNNILSYSNGQNRQVLHFSADFEDYEVLRDNKSQQEDIEMSEKLQNEILELKKQQEIRDAEFKALQEQNSKLKEATETAYKAYKAGEVSKLENATETLPKELKEALFSSLDNVTGGNMIIGEEKSLYSIVAECFENLHFSANVESQTMPGHLQVEPERNYTDEETSEGQRILNSGSESTKMLIG